MSITTCPITGQPLPDGYALHPACANKLVAETADLPQLLSCVEDAKAKRLRTGTSSTYGGAPIPINLEVLESAETERKRMDSVFRELSVTLHTMIPLDGPNIRHYLRINGDRICRLTQKGPDDGEYNWPTLAEWAYANIVHAVHRLVCIIDRAPERTYAGPCPECGADTTCKLNAHRATCQICGTVWDPRIARQKMIEQLADVPCGSVTRLQQVLSVLGEESTHSQVRHRLYACKINLPVTARDYLMKTTDRDTLMLSR